MSATQMVRRDPPKHIAIDLGGRVPPHNEEAEAAVLSAMLCNRRAIDLVLGVIKGPEDFYTDANRRVAEAIYDIHGRGESVDVVTVARFMHDNEKLKAAGGHAYLSTLVDATPAVAHVEAHARIVRSKARRRHVLCELQLAAASAYAQEQEDDDFVAETAEKVFKATAMVNDDEVHDLRSLIAVEEQRLAAIERGERVAGGLPTNFKAIDEALGGLFPGEVTVIGAKPGIGKTAFAGNLAVKIAETTFDGEESGVLFFSVEMPKEQLLRRMAGSQGELNTKRLRAGKLRPSERARLSAAHAHLERLPIFIDDAAGMSPMRIRARLRRVQAQYDRTAVRDDRGRVTRPGRRIRVVIVDYLTLLQPDHVERGMNREQIVGQLAESMRRLAKETGVHVVELAQLVKNLDTKDQMPTLAHLRESGQIEQAAHNIGLLHRPEHYIVDKETLDPELRGLALVNFAKTRDGEPGLVRLHFSGWCTRFDNEMARKPQPVGDADDPQMPIPPSDYDDDQSFNDQP